jgi:hypothetical protein
MPDESYSGFQQQIGAQQGTVQIDNERRRRVSDLDSHESSSLGLGWQNCPNKVNLVKQQAALVNATKMQAGLQ